MDQPTGTPHPDTRDDDVALVTVAVPVYQHAAYVEYCLQSIADQDYDRIELVVIDDGSADTSPEIVQRFVEANTDAFERVEFVARENRGLIATLTELVELARGEFFFPIASDDAMLPGAVTRRVELLEQRPDKLAVFTDCSVVDEHGTTRDLSGIADLHGGQPDALRFERGLAISMMLTWSFPGPSIGMRRSAFDPSTGIGPYSDLGFPEDFDLYLRLAIADAAWFEPERLAEYRVHSESISQQRPDLMQSGNRDTIERLMDRFSGAQRVVAQLILAATSPGTVTRPLARAALWVLRATWPWIARLGARRQGVQSAAGAAA